MLAQHALATVGAIFAQAPRRCRVGDRLTGPVGRRGARARPSYGDERHHYAMAHLAGLVPAPRYRRAWIDAGYYEGRLLVGWDPARKHVLVAAGLWPSRGGGRTLTASASVAADFELWCALRGTRPTPRRRGTARRLQAARARRRPPSALDGYYAEIDEHYAGPVDAVLGTARRRSKLARALERLAGSVSARLRCWRRRGRSATGPPVGGANFRARARSLDYARTRVHA